ncbi:MAG: hypothetical protein Q7K26_01380 [bacterium]|nr:hypothetical protein [bacterium]
MADLHLHVKGEYFQQIKAGTKPDEFRLYEKWAKRIEGKTFDRIFIKWAYPRNSDTSRIIVRKWQGYEVRDIVHPHFGNEPVKVFAIRVN